VENQIEGAEGVHLLNEIEGSGVGLVEDQVVEVGQVFGASSDEVVDPRYFVAFGEEAFTQVGADKAGSAGDQYIHSMSVVGPASC